MAVSLVGNNSFNAAPLDAAPLGEGVPGARKVLKRVENGKTIYVNPEILLQKPSLLSTIPSYFARALFYDPEEKCLVVLSRTSNYTEFARVDENPMDALIQILQQHHIIGQPHFDPRDLAEILSRHIDCQTFVDYLPNSPRARHANFRTFEIRELCKVIQQQGVRINVRQQLNEETTWLQCFLQDGELDKEAILCLLTIDPTLAGDVYLVEEIFFKQSANEVRLLVEALRGANVALAFREDLFARVVVSGEALTPEEVANLTAEIPLLSPSDQQKLYRLANIHSKVAVVRILNKLGMRRQLPLLRVDGPSLYAANMDCVEAREFTLAFYESARREGCLFKLSTFERECDVNNYILKTDRFISSPERKLGVNYMATTIADLRCRYMKVPKKIIVLDDNAFPLTIRADLDLSRDECRNISCVEKVMSVYAERIFPVARQVKPDEVAELLQLVEATQFWDNHSDNFIVGEDGIYWIDTEFGNFRSVGLAYFGESGESLHIGDFRKLRDTVQTLLPNPDEAQPFIARINSWSENCKRNEEGLGRQREERFRAETEALTAVGGLGGYTFTFSEDELFP